MNNQLASKQKNSSWLPLLLGSLGAVLAIGACSVDKSKYSFIPDDEFNSTANAGTGNGNGHGGEGNSNGGEGNPNGGDSGAPSTNTDAGVGNTGATGNGGAPGTCIVGEHNCTADGHLQSCKAGMFDVGVDCGDPGRCSATQGACLKCAPGEFQCSNTTLQQCNIFGSAFDDSATCASKAACVANGQKGFCVQCKAATGTCEAELIKPTTADSGPVLAANRLLTCNADGSGTDTTQVCEADQGTCNATGRTCTRCMPGSFVCDGNQLNVCDPDGSNYSFKKQCISGALCDATNGACLDGPDKCNIGDFNCVGDSLMACDNTGAFHRIDSCGPGLCDKFGGRCQPCSFNASVCTNNVVQNCDGFSLYNSQSCATGTGACTVVNNFAQCGQCKAGTIQCYSGSNNYSMCNGPYNVACPTGQQCNPAAVTDATAPPCVACIPNRFSCDQNGVLSKCAVDGSANVVVQNCRTPNTSSTCNANAGKCIPADVGRYACNDNGDLAQVVYDANHSVITETVTKDANKCGSLNLCESYAGSCRKPQCVVGTVSCANGDVYSCDTGDQRQRTGTHCATATRCQDGFGCVKTLAIAAGDAHTCAIVAGPDAVDGDPGMVLCWGANESGQLGDGSPLLSDSKEARQVLVTMTKDGSGNNTSTSPPVAAPFFTGVCAGKNFTCVDINLNQPGVACWGSNANGQLGLNTADPGPFNSPFNGVQDSAGKQTNGALLTNVTCGAEFGCALGPDGAAWCWGANDSGQQGTGSIGTPSLAAAPVDGHQFTQLQAGARHVCGIQADGTVWCWGDNSSGQLGTGDKKNSATPVMVGTIAAPSDRSLALGNDFSLALSTAKSSKSPYSWGANLFGQLGNGTNGDALSAGPLSGLTTATLGDTGTLYSGTTAEHACARIGDTLQCWGANVFGEVGNNSTDDSPNPVLIFDGKTDATKLAPGAHSVAVGGRHTCAITVKGDVMCWGANHHYQLGSSVLTPQRIPARGY